jgi:hypothetical protein
VPPFVGVAVYTIASLGQRVVLSAATVTDGVSADVTTIVMAVEVAFGVLAQPELLTILTLTWSLLASVVLVKVVAIVLAAPWLTAPMNHSKVGAAPPFAGLAVKVTLVPAQIVFPGFAVMLTAGITVVVTVIAIGVEVTINGLAHVALLVITTS